MINNGNKRSCGYQTLAKPYLIAALYRDLRMPIIVITSKADNANKLKEQIVAWCGSDSNIDLFPEPDRLPYQRVSTDNFSENERIRVLSGLFKYDKNRATPLVIMSTQSLMQKVTALEYFKASYHIIKLGMQIEPYELLKKWQSLGYKSESIVELPGSMSHRGGILDIYPLTSEKPVRLEFMGNTIDSLRLFDPQTQRSQESISSIEKALATELIAPLLMKKSELKGIIDAIDLSVAALMLKGNYKQD